MVYTYNDWWEGKICLIYSPGNFEKGANPILVSWESILKGDIPKIKAKQKELFEKETKTKLDLWKNDFFERYKNSELQNKLLSDEISEKKAMIFGEFPHETDIIFKHSNIIFEPPNLHRIQYYINSIIIKGKEKTFDFIHSPNCPYKIESIIPNEIYGRVVWDYYQFLKELLNQIGQKANQQIIKPENKQVNKNYSQRQITIAYAFLNILITQDNAADILLKHSQTRSIEKLLQKRIYRISDLTLLSENKTTDTKHLKDLKAAKRLISGNKNKKKRKTALTDISRVMTAFETSYNKKY